MEDDTNSDKKKMKKIEWTPQLHKKFVEAIQQLGDHQAVPSNILKFMNVEGLTRQNIASHLQKYKKQQKRSLSQARDWSYYYPHNHVMAFPTIYHSNYQFGPNGVQMMLHADVWGYPVVPSSLGSCSTYPQLYADAWGYPVPPPPVFCTTYPQCAIMGGARQSQGSSSESLSNTSEYYSADEADWMQNNMSNSIPQISLDVHPGEEMIDKVVNEVMSKPWLPLPLGLKLPSIDSMLPELP